MPAISYTLYVNGTAAPPEVLATVQQLEIEDHADKADMLRVRMLTGVRESGSGWTLLDDELFQRLTNLRVTINVGSNPGLPLIDAYIMDSRVKLSNTPGKSEIEIVAMDPTVLMTLDEKVRAWPNMSDSDIASALFGEYGFETDIEDTGVSYDEDHSKTMQRSNDIAFLKSLAKRNGYECFVELNESGAATGHFHKPRVEETPQGVLSVNLGEATNVNAFNARFDMLKPVVAVARSLDIESAEGQDGQADSAAIRNLGSGTTVDPSRPRRVLLSGTGLSKVAELQNAAQAAVDRSSFAIVAEGEMNTVAYGSVLKAKKLVMVRGAGTQFSGTYYVRKVLHAFSGEGYTQKFLAERNALGLEGSENFAEDNALPA